jgi:hypothetical protein
VAKFCTCPTIFIGIICPTICIKLCIKLVIKIQSFNIFINYKFIPPREDQKQSYEYGLTINGRDEIALKNSAGTEKKVKLDLDVKPEELAAVLNQSHAEIYGKVRVPLAVEAPARPQHHHDDEPGQKSPLDSLTLPEDSANRRD